MKKLLFISLLSIFSFSVSAQLTGVSVGPKIVSDPVRLTLGYSGAMDRLFDPMFLVNSDLYATIYLPRFEKNPIKNDFYVLIQPSDVYEKSRIDSEESVGKIRVKPVSAWGVFYLQDSLKTELRDSVQLYTAALSWQDDLDYFFRPFHISQTEITNLQYLEFLTWVKDSLIRQDLGFVNENGKLDREKVIPYEDVEWKQSSSLFEFIGDDPEDPSNYVFRNEQLKFAYYDDWSKDYKQIGIFPDTSCWATDFPYSYNQPMVDYYFTHPAYHDYPVVGVSFEQAKAYCAWLTMMLRSNPEYPSNIIVDLPKPHQWFFALNKLDRGFYNIESSEAADLSFLADLMLKLPDSDNHLNEIAMIRNLNRGVKPVNYTYDGSFFTKPAFRNPKKESKVNPVITDWGPVFGLGDNVSEWIDYRLSEGYNLLFAQRQNHLRSSGNEANLLMADMEKYFSGSIGEALIYGANWFDERYGLLYDKNYEGAYAKTWSDPEMSYSTVGFRVVINYIEPQTIQNN